LTGIRIVVPEGLEDFVPWVPNDRSGSTELAEVQAIYRLVSVQKESRPSGTKSDKRLRDKSSQYLSTNSAPKAAIAGLATAPNLIFAALPRRCHPHLHLSDGLIDQLNRSRPMAALVGRGSL
jgi:hypothetical protein